MKKNSGVILRLTGRQMRRHLLAKQHLTPRTAGPNTEVIAEDLASMASLNRRSAGAFLSPLAETE